LKVLDIFNKPQYCILCRKQFFINFKIYSKNSGLMQSEDKEDKYTVSEEVL